MTGGDLVIYLADPLKFGGELLIIDFMPDGRLVCEAVHWHDEGHEDDAPPRAILEPHEVELASRWARQVL